jgi:hypothetical protein
LVFGAANALVLFRCSSSSTPGSPEDGGATQDSAPLSAQETGADAADDAADAGAPSCALPPSGLTSDESCQACLQASCCQAIVTCFDDPGCVVINSCITSCFAGVEADGGLSACVAACRPDASGAIASAAAAEIACLNGACSPACPGPPLCGYPGGSYSGTCSNCQLVGGAMTCNCVDSAGGTLVSTLVLCGCAQPPVVTNVNGVLTCAGVDGG